MSTVVSSVNTHNIAFKGAVKNNEDKKIDIPEKIKDVGNTVSEATEAVTNSATKITEKGAACGASVIGLFTLAKKPVNAVYNLFTDPVIKDGVEQVTKYVDKNGDEIIKSVRKVNVKKLGVAGALLAVGATALGIIAKVRHDKKVEEAKATEEAKLAEETEVVENENVEVETEE